MGNLKRSAYWKRHYTKNLAAIPKTYGVVLIFSITPSIMVCRALQNVSKHSKFFLNSLRKITSGFWAYILSIHLAHSCIRIKIVMSDLCLTSRPSSTMLFKVWPRSHLHQNHHTFINANFFLPWQTQVLLNWATNLCVPQKSEPTSLS